MDDFEGTQWVENYNIRFFNPETTTGGEISMYFWLYTSMKIFI